MLSCFRLVSHLRFISITFDNVVKARFECVCGKGFDDLCTNCTDKNSPEIEYVGKVETLRLIRCAISVYHNRVINERDSYRAEDSHSEI